MGIIGKDVMEKNEIQRLFKQHYAKMYRVARTLLYDEQESEDVVSDIFESLLLGQTVLLPGTEERYLLTSVRNQCFKRLRHVSTPLDDGDCVEPIDDSEVVDERLTDIDEFVACYLSKQEQRIFRLRFSEGCSYEEIAAAESISRVAVWKHLSHALNQIRNRFNPNKL
jgi:RNA polymerase sigma-70 factor (ECF subfamily)